MHHLVSHLCACVFVRTHAYACFVFVRMWQHSKDATNQWFRPTRPGFDVTWLSRSSLRTHSVYFFSVLFFPAQPGSPCGRHPCVFTPCHAAIELSISPGFGCVTLLFKKTNVFVFFLTWPVAQTLQVSQLSFRIICSSLSPACDLTGAKNKIWWKFFVPSPTASPREREKKSQFCFQELTRAERWRLCVARVTSQPVVTIKKGCSALPKSPVKMEPASKHSRASMVWNRSPWTTV